jgi:hypothetical protein
MIKISQMKNSWLYIFLLILASINYLMCYPGMLTYDSYLQFKQAIDLNLQNHHPALMSVMWHYLNFIHEGPQPMLLLSLGMIWFAVFLLYEACRKYSPNGMLFLFIIPFTPGILCNSAIIWKDVLFGNSVLLALSISTYSYFKQLNQKASILLYVSSLCLIYFGTTIKFQGQFLAPLLIYFITYAHFKLSIRKTALCSLAILALLHINNYLIESHFKVQDNNSAQLRQFFDIAGISTCVDHDLFPTYIREDPIYSFKKIKEHYTYVEVDGYWRIGVYTRTNNQAHLQGLQDSFFNAVSHHPYCYLKHRIRNFLHMVKVGPIIFNKFANFSLPVEAKLIYDFESTFFAQKVATYISSLKLLARNSIFFAINLICSFLFIKLLKRNRSTSLKPYLHVCLSVNLVCWCFYIIMLFTTMASEHRYLYLTRTLTSFYLPLQIVVLFDFYLSARKIRTTRTTN